jgi:hypothetical protein
MTRNRFCIDDAPIFANGKLKDCNPIHVYVITHSVGLHLNVLHLMTHLRFRQANGGLIRAIPAVTAQSILRRPGVG